MKELENYLLEYFKDWDLSEDEKNDLLSVCKTASDQLKPLYNLMEKMSESDAFRDQIIDTIDKTLTEEKDDNKTDT